MSEHNKPRKWKKNRTLEKAGHFIYEISGMLNSSTNRQLKAVVDSCDSLSEVNCGWGVYYIAPTVRKMAVQEINRRARAKAIKKAAGTP